MLITDRASVPKVTKTTANVPSSSRPIAIRRPLRRTPFSWLEGDPIAQNPLRQTAAASVEKKNPTGWRNTKFSFECKSNLGG